MSETRQKIETYLHTLQDRICENLVLLEGNAKTFREDEWVRPHGGGGRSRVLAGGDVWEQAGVNFSHVFGTSLPPSASKARPALAGSAFHAVGLSLVIHPRNPYVPTTHCNLRYFEALTEPVTWWFGGGFDLTPYYGFAEDARHWHTVAHDACRDYEPACYERYKAWCDEYFFIKHRNEPRGIGGLFFDDVNSGDFAQDFAFVQNVGEHFLAAYLPIVHRRMGLAYGERERDFQLYRRGRYVEFNLVYDRGTLFGLQSGGRAESILMSLPPEVRFRYDWHPEAGSPEALLYDLYLKPRNWLTWPD